MSREQGACFSIHVILQVSDLIHYFLVSWAQNIHVNELSAPTERRQEFKLFLIPIQQIDRVCLLILDKKVFR